MNDPRSPFASANRSQPSHKVPGTPVGSATRLKPHYGISSDDIKTGMAVYCYVADDNLWVKGQISGVSAEVDFVTVETTDDKRSVRVSRGALAVRGPCQQSLEDVCDLTTISPLSAPAVLDCLSTRYTRDIFYTNAGSTLVVVNPFKTCTGLYGDPVIAAYHDNSQDKLLLPSHIYHTAEAAHRGARRSAAGRRDTSVVVSGESGAGKTVSAKHVMKYLVTVANKGSQRSQDVGKEVEKRILGSNPILEAFGNASTLRNHNSSRFGKYIELQFDRTHQLEGATIHTYLLEKTRVTHQQEGECNFHILYQLLCHSTDPSVHALLCPDLGGPSPDGPPVFRIADRQTAGRSAAHDTEDWRRVTAALTDMGFTETQRGDIVRILCALLHLGNIELTPDEDEEEVACVDGCSQLSLDTASWLLGLDPSQLERTLTYKRITASHRRRQSVFYKPCTPVQAGVRRDTVAKLVYQQLFDWLVDSINKSIRANKPANTIGILDIYGFESFEHNSLEQLCINYANEKLQQHYVTYFLRDLQADYAREAVPWTFTEFSDNRLCVQLLEANPGLFAVLDEECQLNRPSAPASLSERILTSLSESPHLARPRRDPATFTVIHYAQPVTYSVSGMVDKNKDDIPPELVELLQKSTLTFLCDLCRDLTPQHAAGSRKKKSVLAKFKSSLLSLMALLEQTQPHYVRCIKPNTRCVAGDLDQSYVLSQLQACGVIETVEISRQAFPASGERLSYEDFLQQYGIVLNSAHIPGAPPPRHDPAVTLDLSHNTEVVADDNKENELLFDPLDMLYRKQLNMTPTKKSATPKRKLRRRADCGMSVVGDVDKGLSSADHTRRLSASIMKLVFGSEYTDQPSACAQFGKTKIFLRDGQLERLESLRLRILSCRVFTVQCAWRRHRQRRRISRRRATVHIQAVVRGWLVRQRLHKQHTAATKIQTAYRRHRDQTFSTPRGSSHLPEGPTIQCHSPLIGAMVSSACASHARNMAQTPFYTPMTSKRPLHPKKVPTDEFQTPLRGGGDAESKVRRKFKNEEDEFIFDQERMPDGDIVYHIRESPHRNHPRARSARDVYHNVAAAMTAAFLTRRRFHLAGAFCGIPYLEASHGIMSRRRLPRVQIKFHTRANSLLKYGHYMHRREFECSLQDCLKEMD